MLAELACTASVPGNRETHVLPWAMQRKMAGASHPVLCGNWRSKSGDAPFGSSLTWETSIGRVGVIAAMVPMVTERMRTQAASAYLWDPPIATLQRDALALRDEVDLLIALTHIGYAQDQRLAAEVPEIDIVLGGHSHTVLATPVKVGRTWLAQTGSHARFAGRYEWDGTRLLGELVPLTDEQPA